MSKMDQLRAMREARHKPVASRALSQLVTRNWLPYAEVTTVSRKGAEAKERREKAAERQRKSRARRRGVNLDLAAREIARATDV